MALNYLDLVEQTRMHMADEIQFDKDHNNFYLSNFLSPKGKEQWPALLEESVQHDDQWLEREIVNRRLLAEFYPKRKRRGSSG